jgi:hypothetical protein
MKKNNIMNTKYLWILLVFLGFFACKEEDDFVDPPAELPVLTAGNADFSNFVAIGNSLTAGFTDNALFIAGQENSIPNILSQQFALVGGGSFNQPLMNDNFGGMLAGGNRILDPRLVFNGSAPAPLESVIGPVAITTDLAVNNPAGPFNNMGVPGAKVGHLLFDGYGNIANLGATANPYFIRMASSPSATMLGDAAAQNPSFFSLWIGNNDVLGYALSGGESNPSADNYSPITPLNGALGVGFQETYSYILSTLTSNGAQGVIANIPSVTSIPHFTSVPHNPVPLDAATATFLNSTNAYGAYNAGIGQAFAFMVANNMITQEEADEEIAKRTITFQAGEGNAVVILDEALTDLTFINPALLNMRQATANDLLVLPASSFIGTEAIPGNPQTVNGVAVPLADKWVLTPEEQTEIEEATNAFNQVINSAATQHNLALVDTNSLMQQLSSGNYVSGNFNPSSSLVTGGVFSLDGVHPNSRGYALIANEFMKAIDAAYESNFEASGNFVDIGNYPTNYSPLLQ